MVQFNGDDDKIVFFFENKWLSYGFFVGVWITLIWYPLEHTIRFYINCDADNVMSKKCTTFSTFNFFSVTYL